MQAKWKSVFILVWGALTIYMGDMLKYMGNGMGIKIDIKNLTSKLLCVWLIPHICAVLCSGLLSCEIVIWSLKWHIWPYGTLYLQSEGSSPSQRIRGCVVASRSFSALLLTGCVWWSGCLICWPPLPVFGKVTEPGNSVNVQEITLFGNISPSSEMKIPSVSAARRVSVHVSTIR